MELKLVREDNPILKQVAEPWDFGVDREVHDLIRRMAKVMLENNGIGLAAPQVGISKRIFVMGNETKLFACINPEILEGSGQIMDKEGCLSFPDLWLSVRRSETVKVKYQNALGEIVETQFTGIMARVFQHERDHLDGICFDILTSKVSLELANKRRKKLRKRRFS